MGKIKVRYLVIKRQKGHALYYWQPTRLLRTEGWLTRRLAERTNDLSDAIREAESFNAELDAWRKGETVDTAPKEGTIPWLIQHYQQSDKYSELAASTRKNYDKNLKEIEAWSARTGHRPISAITPMVVEKLYKSLKLRAPHQAAALVRVLRLLLNRALKLRLIDYNPAAKPEISTPPPRHQVWSDEDIAAVISRSEEMGHKSIAVAVMLAAYLGQRQEDVLKLSWTMFEGGNFKVRQQKTGRFLEVPAAKPLLAYLNQNDRSATTIVVSEATQRPYKPDHFRHVFSQIRDAVGLKGLQFRDLRRTAAVRLAEAGCTAPEIAAITGHKIETTQRILDTYVPRTAPMARNAIKKLEKNKKRSKLEG